MQQVVDWVKPRIDELPPSSNLLWPRALPREVWKLTVPKELPHRVASNLRVHPSSDGEPAEVSGIEVMDSTRSEWLANGNEWLVDRSEGLADVSEGSGHWK